VNLRVTTLSENTASAPDLLAEWGLSIYLEADGLNILFDAGQSISAAFNAELLGVDLTKVDKVVLSHGHHDHTGGLEPVLRKMGKEVELVAHPDVWQAKYRHKEGLRDKYNGIPFQRSLLESLGARFVLAEKPVRISEHITTSGEIPMVTGFERIPSTLCVKDGGRLVPDRLMDDQALFITTEWGLVVILGCGHHGLVNTLYHARDVTGIRKIHTVVGGCHLHNSSEEQILLTMAALKDLDVERIGVSHCTGMAAVALMAHEFGDRFFYNNAGTVVDLLE